MLKVIVVEDERLTMERICSLLRETGRVEVIGGYTNPHEAMEQIFRHQPEAVFLDIEMPELSGLQLAEKIYESELQSEIIFITAYNEYALEAFRVNALDYILKPVTAKELNRAVDRVEKRSFNQAAVDNKVQKVRVAALGGYSVWINSHKEPVRWCTAKCGELFAYFALQDSSADVSKWKLIELLWPDRDSEKGDINLRSTLCRLNKTLRESGTGMRVISNRNSYHLKADSMTVDALEIQKLALNGKAIEKATLSEYEAALASYKGNLFEGYDFNWCEELRVNYQRYFVTLARNLAGYHMEQGNNPILALNAVEALLKLEPYDEEAYCMSLKLHFMKGGKAAKDEYYHKLCGIFEKDLGIKPGDKLVELNNKLI